MKKILIVDAFQGLGGEESIAYKIYELIDRSKFQVYLTGPRDSIYLKKFPPEDSHWIKFDPTGKFSFRRMYLFRKLVVENDFDIINVHGYSAGFFVRMALCGLNSVKVVWTMHLDISAVSSMNTLKRYVATFFENVLNKSVFFTDKIIAVSKESKERLVSRGVRNVPIEVVYNGIDCERFKEPHSFSSHGISIGFIARLSVQKNIPFVLNVAKKLAEEKIDFHLYIAGDGELREQVETTIKVNKLEDRVKLIGFKKDVREVLRMVDIVILPSLYECFPVVVLESLSAGIPVIASNVNGIPEQLIDGKSGYLIDPNDLDLTIGYIKQYYSNINIAKAQGEFGREYVNDHFSVKKMIDSYNMIFSEV
ncbi:MAG: glycosyltransferase family 4 protein [Bifidobacterium pullorum]|uniref:glycosyltransferase family 4 protein n=1 Tax=Bifidobacterium pullorum TaxID=78448 RepID=UPI0039930D0B